MKYFLVCAILLTIFSGIGHSQDPAQKSGSVASAGGKDLVCDGGIEIIPSGRISFSRKRYVAPTKNTAKSLRSRARR